MLSEVVIPVDVGEKADKRLVIRMQEIEIYSSISECQNQ